MFETEIEFMDGQVRNYPSRHLSRTDKESGVYRMLFDHEEVNFPLCNIRKIRTITVKDPEIPNKDRTEEMIAKYYQKQEAKNV
jgi:hypothetical protein